MLINQNIKEAFKEKEELITIDSSAVSSDYIHIYFSTVHLNL